MPKRSILKPLLFSIYINDLSDDLTINVNLFSDDTIVHNMSTPTTNLNNDLNKIKNWAIHGKRTFTPILVNKLTKLYFQYMTNHNHVYFNHNSTEYVPFQKLLGMYLDPNFQEHLNKVLSEVNKTIGLLHKL